MPKTATNWAAAALFSLFIAGSLQAQAPATAPENSPLPSIESLEQQSAEAFAAGDAQRAYEINLQLHQRRPYAVDYMITASLSVLDVAAKYKNDLLYNRYQAARDVIAQYRSEPPYGFFIAQDQRDPVAAVSRSISRPVRAKWPRWLVPS